jgi:hypothetical protein
MRNLIVIIVASALLIGLTSAVSAQGKRGKHPDKLMRQEEVRQNQIGRSTGMPVLFHRRVVVRRRAPFVAIRRRGVVTNYGQRRSALSHRQNAERKALHERFKEERQTAKIQGLDRRDLAMRQNQERRVLLQRQKSQRRAIRP